MKIPSDLRVAIKSTINHIQKKQDRWETNRMLEKSACEDVLVANKRLFAKHKKDYMKGKTLTQAATDWAGTLGISDAFGSPRIVNSTSFAKAGGKQPPTTPQVHYDTVICDLALATPEQGAKILEKLGINWK